MWLNIQNRRTIDRIEPCTFPKQIFYRQQTTNRDSNTIGPILTTLSEDADFRPVKSMARMTRTSRYLGFTRQMKEKNDLNVRNGS